MNTSDVLTKLKAEIERLKQLNEISDDKDYAQYEIDVACGYDIACEEILHSIASLQQEQPDFPTTDEEIERLLTTHSKVEVPDKYKTPDWLWKNQEQPELPKIGMAEYYYHKGVYEGILQGRAAALKILEEFMKRKADTVIVIKQPEVDLEKAALHVYESWMGGTMDHVRRDIVELGKVLNARKED